jgi:hypothetical protein
VEPWKPTGSGGPADGRRYGPGPGGNQHLHHATDAYREVVRRKVLAYHRYLQVGCIAQGLLLHLSLNYTAEVWHAFRSWLRTMNPGLPPLELVVAHALRSGIPGFFASRLLEPSMKKILSPFRDAAGDLGPVLIL